MMYIGVYLVMISLLAIYVTLRDKSAARRKGRRIPERTLLLISVLGGSVVMLITMRLSRHKTLHKRFMIGIPVMIVLQIVAVSLVLTGMGQLAIR